MESGKVILDACCGGRMMWYEKHHPTVLYIDVEPRPKGSFPERPNWECSPDEVADYTSLPFPDESFYHVVWDPPHKIEMNKKSRYRIIYGGLVPEVWPNELRKGFSECWRVLKPGGTLIFKWSESNVPLKDVLACFPIKPLYGHPTGKFGTSHWMAFVKIPQ